MKMKLVFRTSGQKLVLFEWLVFYPFVASLMRIVCDTVGGIVLFSHCIVTLYINQRPD